ncbi:type II toxin-antitoxin system VapC family toxin [Nonomuraea sp. B10E15]|uniref:type II toxin-antitoxin system VapC family toxin n=1 Tax=Nonomuraea sp. B10E15 TaxID=3153560 RepID=UPI00325C4C73
MTEPPPGNFVMPFSPEGVPGNPGFTWTSVNYAPIAAEQARADYLALSISRYETRGISDRVWELRHNYTAYDASCLALAEAFEAPLLTCDGKLVGSGHNADVQVFPRA